MTTDTSVTSHLKFAEAYRALRGWVMESYAITPAQLEEPAALSLTGVGMMARRRKFLGYRLDLAPAMPIGALLDYLRHLPHYSFDCPPNSQSAPASRAHAVTLGSREVTSLILRSNR